MESSLARPPLNRARICVQLSPGMWWGGRKRQRGCTYNVRFIVVSTFWLNFCLVWGKLLIPHCHYKSVIIWIFRSTVIIMQIENAHFTLSRWVCWLEIISANWLFLNWNNFFKSLLSFGTDLMALDDEKITARLRKGLGPFINLPHDTASCQQRWFL